jgi:hypothetical protein
VVIAEQATAAVLRQTYERFKNNCNGGKEGG